VKGMEEEKRERRLALWDFFERRKQSRKKKVGEKRSSSISILEGKERCFNATVKKKERGRGSLLSNRPTSEKKEKKEKKGAVLYAAV